LARQLASPARRRWTLGGAIVSAISLAFIPLGTINALPADAVGSGSVSGVVTYDGVVADNVTVRLSPQAGAGDAPEASTNSAGEYSFADLDLGDYEASIVQQPENPGGHPGVFSGIFTLDAEVPNAVVNLALAPWATGSGKITGTVTDSASGEPITDAVYNFSGDGQALSSSGSVNTDGVYTVVDLPAGDFTLSVDATGYVSASSISVSVEDGETVVLDFSLVARNASIGGHVEDSDGNPIADATVSIRDGTPMGGYYVQTNSTGDYVQADMGAGDYTVSVGGSGTNWQLSTRTVAAIAEAIVTADFVLAPRVTGSISGRILDDSGGRLAGICAQAYTTGDDFAGGSATIDGTDASGNYIIDDLEVGDYVLLFWDCNYQRLPAYAFTYYGDASNFAAATRITVSPNVDESGKDVILALGGTISGNIDLAAPGGTVDLPSYGRMDATTYQLVGSDWVEFPDLSPMVSLGGLEDYIVPGLPDGTFRIGFIDQRTGPRSYTPQYWNDKDSLLAATDIIISGGTIVTGIDATMVIPRPSGEPAAVATEDLAPSEEGDISSDSDAKQGETVEVQNAPDQAGQWVSVWGHSTPVLLGNWVQVSTTGKIAVPISSTMPTGAHKLVVQNADGEVIGWSSIQIAAGSASSSLASTGSPVTTLIIPFVGALLLIAAGAVLGIRRRPAKRVLPGPLDRL
jgi:hypothetical protein